MYTLSKTLKTVVFSESLVLMAGAMIGPIYALFVEDIGGNLLDASFAGAAFMLAAGFMALFSGRISDAVKEPKYVVAAGYAIMAIGYALFIWVGSIWSLLAVQVLIGLGEALYSPPLEALFGNNVEKANSAKQWSAWDAVFYFTSAIGAIAGGIIVNVFGFTVLFVMMSILCCSGALYIIRNTQTNTATGS